MHDSTHPLCQLSLIHPVRIPDCAAFNHYYLSFEGGENALDVLLNPVAQDDVLLELHLLLCRKIPRLRMRWVHCHTVS